MSLKTDMNLVWSDRLTRAWHFGSIQTHDKDLDKVLVDDHDSYRPVKEAEGMPGVWSERRYLQPQAVERWEQKT
jgi:hypothetical protein